MAKRAYIFITLLLLDINVTAILACISLGGGSSSGSSATTTTTTTTAATVLSSTYKVVDTGVSTCYSDSAVISAPSSGADYYGQDGTYSGNQPSYTNNNDGTITDQNTGLMWMQAVTSKMTYSAAQTAVSSYSYAGYSDWRIPTIKELYSLILFSGDVSGITAGTNRFIDTNYFTQPLGDTSAGEREIDAQTLSGTTYTGLVFGSTACNFGVNFIDGRIKCYETTNSWYFRYVRGNTDYGKNSFTNNGDETITDSATGLMWQRGDSGSGMIWKDALSYCENLVLASRSDWRLPNIKELQSIVDYTRSPSATSSAAINSMFTVTSVTEPDSTSDYPYYWSGTTHNDGGYTPVAYIAFGRGWGKPASTLIDVHGAGAQRSDPKQTFSETYPQYMGPQGDLRVVYNYARCVRTC